MTVLLIALGVFVWFLVVSVTRQTFKKNKETVNVFPVCERGRYGIIASGRLDNRVGSCVWPLPMHGSRINPSG